MDRCPAVSCSSSGCLAGVLVLRALHKLAHRLSTIRAADRIFAMEGGRLVEQGSHAELFARGGVCTELCSEYVRD